MRGNDALRGPRFGHKGHTCLDCVSGFADRHDFAANAQLSRRGRFDPRNHPRKRRAARAQQTRQAQNFAPMQRKADIVGLMRPA